MFDEVNQTMREYEAKWQSFIGQRKNKEFFERLKTSAVGWKVKDLAEYDRLFNLWRDACDHIHVARLNDRWLATLHLRDVKLEGDIQILKLMQARPGSQDSPGLDHVDFYDTEETNTKAILEEETGIKWTEEENGFCKWFSIWFDGTEAKLKGYTSVQVGVEELQAVNEAVLAAKGIKP